MSMWGYGNQPPTPGAGSPGAYSSNPGVTVGILWEEPAELANGSVRLRAILGSANTDTWAGASIYATPSSADYRLLFRTTYRSTIGVTLNVLAAGASDYQPAGTVDVDLSASPGVLISTDPNGLLAGVNKCLIGDEVCTFQTATLIGANQYRLTGLMRAWYDTERVAHAGGSQFALLTDLQTVVDVPEDWYNTQPWYWKAASINIGGVEQSLALATEHTLNLTLRGLHIEFQKGRTKQFIAGETLTQGQLVYLNTGTLRVLKAVSASTPRLGLVLNAASVAAGEKVYVQMDGLMSCPTEATPIGASWTWTPGALLYASAVAGVLSQTSDGYPPVAVCLDSAYTILVFAPQPGTEATFFNTGLHLLDTNASHDLIIAPGSDLTADRTLTVITDDAARSFSLLGNLTVEAESLVNQDLTTDANAQFSTIGAGRAPTAKLDAYLGNLSGTIAAFTGGNTAQLLWNNLNTNWGSAQKLILQSNGVDVGHFRWGIANSYPGLANGNIYAEWDVDHAHIWQIGGVEYARLAASALTLGSGIQFVGEYQTQSGAWAAPAGGTNGQIVTVWNSTQAATRLYAYSNGAWTWVLMN